MMKDFIDIHSHSLWGIDDGARDFSEAVNMCFCAEENATSTLFLTPHLIYWDYAEELYDKREAKIERLAGVLEEEDSSLIIKKGFEILCDDEIFNIKHFKPYTLCESRYILIEFDFRKTTADDVDAWCRYLQSFGLVPVIAHPERYNFVLDDVSVIDRLSEKGNLFQINAGSPAGMFGEEVMNVSVDMINCGYADFIGSDAHSITHRNTDMLSCFEEYPYDADVELVMKAAQENGKYILEDRVYFPKRKKNMGEL